MPTIADAAAAALTAQQGAARAARLTDAARERLSVVLAPPAGVTPIDVAALSVAAVDDTEQLVVFTDGSTYLAVTRDDTVALVGRDGEDWTRLADVTDLPALGAALAAQTPTTTGGEPT